MFILCMGPWPAIDVFAMHVHVACTCCMYMLHVHVACVI